MLVLGVEDKLVGSAGLSNSSTARYLIPELNKLPDVGSITTGINYETVATVDPDLVIVRKSVYFQDQGDKAVETIESLDIPVIVLKRSRSLSHIRYHHNLSGDRTSGQDIQPDRICTKVDRRDGYRCYINYRTNQEY